MVDLIWMSHSNICDGMIYFYLLHQNPQSLTLKTAVKSTDFNSETTESTENPQNPWFLALKSVDFAKTQRFWPNSVYFGLFELKNTEADL